MRTAMLVRGSAKRCPRQPSASGCRSCPGLHIPHGIGSAADQLPLCTCYPEHLL